MRRLNLGAGSTVIDGFEPRDGAKGDSLFPLPDEAGSVDEIRASHVLEHFPHGQVQAVLADWARVLKPGGVLRVAVPNFQWVAEQYLAGEDVNAQGYVMGGQTNERDFHRALFGRDLLSRLLGAVGLVGVRDWTSEIEDCAALPVSLNLAASKPGPRPRISAVASMPRLGFNDFWGVMYDQCAKRGIQFRRSQGVFWGIKLTQAFETALDSDRPEWLLALDYDTVFTGAQLDALIDVASRHPEADAIAPIQASRHHSMPMLTVASGTPGMNRARLKREEFDQELLKVRTAHFGCTLLRAEKIRALPKPWFNEEPDEKGGWGPGSIHEDIWFWKQWEKAGFSAYLACRVPVGHCDLAVRWPDVNLETTYQSPRDFIKQGPPDEVWR